MRIGVLALAVLTLAQCAVPVHAAKSDKPDKPDRVDKPDKVEKPDKTEKPDKVSDKPDKLPKSDRSSQSERGWTPPSNGKKSFRAEKAQSRAVSPAPTTPAAAVVPGSYEAFQAIPERNIFNPNRVARVRDNPPEPPRIETVALVGVLQSDGGVVAFFHSEDRHLQQIVREGETIGGLSVMQIAPGGVQLMQEGEPLFIRVNQQMRRVEGGAWKPLPRDVARPEVARAADGTPLPAIPPGASEVLRRLMEQRQKQLKQ